MSPLSLYLYLSLWLALKGQQVVNLLRKSCWLKICMEEEEGDDETGETGEKKEEEREEEKCEV